MLKFGKINRIILFIGEAGVGKTYLAKQYVANYQNNYSCYIIKTDSAENMLRDITMNDSNNSLFFIDECHKVFANEQLIDAIKELRGYIIGCTTPDLYQRITESALLRRIISINVPEPDKEKTINILKNNYPEVTQENAIAVYEYASKYMFNEFNPAKSLKLVDFLYYNIGSNFENNDIEDAVKLITKRKHLERNLDEFKHTIIGQDIPIKMILQGIKLNRKFNERKPFSAMIFGKTGVGKTEFSIQLADYLDAGFLRIDCNELKESHKISKLVGSAAGYVGYNDGGSLVNHLNAFPQSVILFDEIEKANPIVFDLIMNMLDYGVITNQYGRKVDCRDTIILFTSNIPVQMEWDVDKNNMKINISALKYTFRKEFIGRIKCVTCINDLTNNDLYKIAINIINSVLKDRNDIIISDEELNVLINKTRNFGVRHLAEEIKKMIYNRIINEQDIITSKLIFNYLDFTVQAEEFSF
jgi:ATP-dependent Clp protease ATP-binding subunit ClpA